MKIENYREQPQSVYFLALFDVYLEKIGLTFKNLKLCVSKKGIHFLGYPSYAEDQEDGSKKWFPYYSFSSEKKKDFEEKIFQELQSLVRGPIIRGRSP